MTPGQRWAGAVGGLSTSQKSVLNALASMSNKDLTCFPSIGYLATMCSLSDRSIQRSLAAVVRLGHIEVTARRSGSRAQSSNLYRLTPPKSWFEKQLERVRQMPKMASPVDATVTAPGGVAVTQNSDSSILSTHYEQPTAREHGAHLAFPSQTTQAEQAMMSALLREVDQGQAQQILDELAGRMRIQPPVANPIGYLRALVTRLGQGTFVPEHAGTESQRRERARKTNLQAAKPVDPQSFAPPGPEIKAKLNKARADLIARIRAA